LNPRPPPCESWRMRPKTEITAKPKLFIPKDLFTSRFWDSFEDFVSQSCNERATKDRVRYAMKYAYCLVNGDLSELTVFSDSKRSHVLKALSALAKFMGVYQHFKSLVSAYGLKWKSVDNDDLIISRLLKYRNTNEIVEWVKAVKAKFPRLTVFMDFLVASGLRMREAVNAYNLIVDLTRQNRLSEYYDSKSEVLEHFRFKQLFIRRTKKVFITFVPKKLVERISKSEKLTCYQIENWIKRNRLKSRFGDLREYYATLMTRYLSQPEIDFLQGRVSANVFMRNYFNPTLIRDLKRRVMKGIKKILENVENA